MGGKKKQVRKIISIILYVIGLIACAYPVVSSVVMQRYQNNSVATYEAAVSAASEQDLTEVLTADATEYNEMLYQTEMITAGNVATGILSDEHYKNLLNVSANGVMGSIEIPKIDVNLPIYHGTSDEVLDIGVGHVRQSSLPIGGVNTRTVLTGHRGLPNSKLFTRLDELEVGDLFYIYVLGETLAYQVCEIDIIKPEDVDKLGIQKGKDLATLVTCHPYGINTQRLIVTGERIEYEEKIYDSIKSEMMSVREFIFLVLPGIFIVFGIATVIVNRKDRKKVKKQDV